MLYANFQYGRLRLLGDDVTWEHIDQVHNEVMVEVKLVFGDQGIGIIEVGENMASSPYSRGNTHNNGC